MPRIFSLSDVEELVRIARCAGDLILRIRAEHDEATQDLGVLAKGDGSPVSRADTAAQELILNEIEKAGLQAPVIAEETEAHEKLESGKGFYLIDPLDGTKAFVGGGDDFTVNIGYAKNGVPVMGVLHVPVCGHTYYTDGAQAYVMESGVVRRIAARQPNPEALEVIVNRTEDPLGKLKAFLSDKKVSRLERRSSAHKLGLVAAGEYDFYPRFGPTCEWDIAAGDAILRAAGGSVRTLDGALLTYGKATYRNPAFVAYGKPLI